MSSEELPANVIDALAQGRTIEAIKLLRKAHGIGLKEAKDIIETRLGSNPLPRKEHNAATDLPADVVDALVNKNKIKAIKLLREQTGLGLAEAKQAVESWQSDAPAEKFESEGNHLWLLVVVLAAIALAYAAYV